MKRACCILLLPVLSVCGGGESWTADEAMLQYFDAATAIRRQALDAPDFEAIVTGSLAGYVRTLDPHSRFFSAADHARWVDGQSADYAGVGMELATDREGRFVCLPYPGSPAEAAGIRDGDYLLAVDGEANRAMDLVTMGMRVRGASGSTASLRIRTGQEPVRNVDIVRRALRAPSAVGVAGKGIPWIRIYRFTASTVEELANAVPESGPVVIDLRGNPGGSLYDAIDSAGLFLARGTFIAGVRTRDRSREHHATRPARFPDTALWLLQDERTASSAEVFVAALTGHGRARSLGTRTAGKGTTQSMIQLSGGAALLLTVGELRGPNGLTLNGAGLAPSIPLNIDADVLDERVRQAIGISTN